MPLLKNTDIRSDQELIEFLEGLRRVGIQGHDELDEIAGMLRMKVERLARRNGAGRMAAKSYGRAVALPIARAADAMLLVAGYAKMCRNRFEALIVALDEEHTGTGHVDFKVSGLK